MSITAALVHGRAGLSAAATWAEATSANIANADRPDYVRADIRRQVGPDGVLTGARIVHERTERLDRALRVEAARAARQDAIATELSLHTARLGQPGDPGTLGVGLSRLESAFDQLAIAPEEASFQRAALGAAETVARTFRDLSASLDRTEAAVRGRIDASITAFNDGLRRVAASDAALRYGAEGADRALASDLDELAALADVRVHVGPRGALQVYAARGARLADPPEAAPIRFDAATGRLYAGGLSGEVDITPRAADARGPEEGRLAGEIELLTSILPDMRAELDALAGGLIAAFEATDASRGAGDAGLFTDAGAALGSGPTPGLAGRIAVSDRVNPDAGGDLRRLRDGVGAAAPGPAGASEQADAFVALFSAPAPFAPGAGPATLHEVAAALVTGQAGVRIDAEARRDDLDARAATMRAARDGVTGVDVDAELETLMRIEQSYAASSRVIQSLTQMFDRLLAAT